MIIGLDKQVKGNETFSVLHKCAKYILSVSMKDINLADYDLLESVEKLINDNV